MVLQSSGKCSQKTPATTHYAGCGSLSTEFFEAMYETFCSPKSFEMKYHDFCVAVQQADRTPDVKHKVQSQFKVGTEMKTLTVRRFTGWEPEGKFPFTPIRARERKGFGDSKAPLFNSTDTIPTDSKESNLHPIFGALTAEAWSKQLLEIGHDLDSKLSESSDVTLLLKECVAANPLLTSSGDLHYFVANDENYLHELLQDPSHSLLHARFVNLGAFASVWHREKVTVLDIQNAIAGLPTLAISVGPLQARRPDLPILHRMHYDPSTDWTWPLRLTALLPFAASISSTESVAPASAAASADAVVTAGVATPVAATV